MTRRPASTDCSGTAKGLNRRTLLKGVAASGVALSAPWVTTAARAAGQITVILNQGLLAKLWIDELHPIFEKQTGAKIAVQQSVTGAMLGMLKTQKDNPPDLMQFSEAGVHFARADGLLKAHDPSKIPNFANLRPSFNMADNFSAGCIDAMHTLHYNTKLISSGPDSWAALWDPKNKNKIAIPTIAFNSGVRMVVTAAQVATGKPFKEAQYELGAGMAHLAKLKEAGAVVVTSAPQAIQMLQSGQVPLVPIYGSWVNQLIDQGAPFAPATTLKEGKHGEIVGLNMPVNVKNLELAQVYTDISLSKDFQSKIDSVLKARCGHKDIEPSEATLKVIGPAGNTDYADWAYLSRERSKLADKWNEVFG